MPTKQTEKLDQPLVEQLWQEFECDAVIRNLCEAVEDRWGIKVNFTDSRGWLRGVAPGRFFSPANQICEMIVRNERGFQDRKNTAMRATAALSADPIDFKLMRCTTGVSVLAVPIVAAGNYVGIAYADGWVTRETQSEQFLQIENYLQRFIGSELEIDTICSLELVDVKFLARIVQSIVNHIAEGHFQTLKPLTPENGRSSKNPARNTPAFSQIIGNSGQIRDVVSTLEMVKDSDATILVTGENGTGKEQVASCLHYESARKKAPFVAINCGAFNENLLDSELFGHVKGAFTGANSDRDGLFTEANEGTIFLDEIGDTPPAMQVKLLRVLQEGTFLPVGSTIEAKTNARVICATNRDLEKMVKTGSFREDLFYRLNVITIKIPALRERGQDIELLARFFLEKFCQSPKSISAELLQALTSYRWPGNIRQLENEMQRMSVLIRDELLKPEHLSPLIQDQLKSTGRNYRAKGKLKDSVDSYERQQIIDGLKRFDGNKSALAREMGVSRTSLAKKIKKHKILA